MFSAIQRGTSHASFPARFSPPPRRPWGNLPQERQASPRRIRAHCREGSNCVPGAGAESRSAAPARSSHVRLRCRACRDASGTPEGSQGSSLAFSGSSVNSATFRIRGRVGARLDMASLQSAGLGPRFPVPGRAHLREDGRSASASARAS